MNLNNDGGWLVSGSVDVKLIILEIWLMDGWRCADMCV